MELIVIVLLGAVLWFGPMKEAGVCKPELPSTPVEQTEQKK